MSVKVVTTSMEGKAKLTFLTSEDKMHDIHVGVEGDLVVIAKNNYKKKGGSTGIINNCSNPALCFEEDKIFLQYVEDGETKWKDVDPDTVYDLLNTFLEDISND